MPTPTPSSKRPHAGSRQSSSDRPRKERCTSSRRTPYTPVDKSSASPSRSHATARSSISSHAASSHSSVKSNKTQEAHPTDVDVDMGSPEMGEKSRKKSATSNSTAAMTLADMQTRHFVNELFKAEIQLSWAVVKLKSLVVPGPENTTTARQRNEMRRAIAILRKDSREVSKAWLILEVRKDYRILDQVRALLDTQAEHFRSVASVYFKDYPLERLLVTEPNHLS